MSGEAFDYVEVQKGIVRWLTPIVGNMMGNMVLKDGTVTTTPAIYIAPLLDYPEPTLPLLEVSFEQDDNNQGHILSRGIVDVPDPADPTNTLSVPYYDTYINYSIRLLCEGTNSQNILRKVRNSFNVQALIDEFHNQTHSGVNKIGGIRRSPRLITVEFRESSMLTLRLSTVDRYIDYDGSFFSEITYEGELKDDPDDTDPLPIDNTVIGT